MHLLNRCEHGETCTQRACGEDCGYRRYEQWLAAPPTEWDARRDALVEQRRQALWRGDIPG
ncbi:hypothetical protein [Micromonospora cathayae]|uniref:Post-SET domain-containing protein n=1 Tax=Micromonospora cathayae TaxID=3028804 RepID=A0ABY7ZXL0_9ACTN|nr:hypothetical protein [Micromonospora sp. HUAS 3]WDZ87183.1 hypothetical protein PVK37_12645 [Micromonospora sp. HUAS 3]